MITAHSSRDCARPWRRDDRTSPVEWRATRAGAPHLEQRGLAVRQVGASDLRCVRPRLPARVVRVARGRERSARAARAAALHTDAHACHSRRISRGARRRAGGAGRAKYARRGPVRRGSRPLSDRRLRDEADELLGDVREDRARDPLGKRLSSRAFGQSAAAIAEQWKRRARARAVKRTAAHRPVERLVHGRRRIGRRGGAVAALCASRAQDVRGRPRTLLAHAV